MADVLPFMPIAIIFLSIAHAIVQLVFPVKVLLKIIALDPQWRNFVLQWVVQSCDISYMFLKCCP